MPYGQFDDVSLWYQQSGDEGPALVLVHGAAGSSECWVEQVPSFVDAGFRVVTYDLRGFGRTKAEPGREAAGSMAGDLEGLSRLLELPRFYLVAQAYGGFGALEFALDNPGRLYGLVVSTSFGGLTDPEFTTLRARYVSAEVAALPVEERELGRTYRQANGEGVERFLAMERGSYRAAESRQQLRSPLSLQRLEAMQVPTLLIAGEEDVLAPPPVMHALAERIPCCQFRVIERAGHCAYWEQPRVWSEIVVEFLKGQPKQEG